jgi:hypothetical protein
VAVLGARGESVPQSWPLARERTHV